MELWQTAVAVVVGVPATLFAGYWYFLFMVRVGELMWDALDRLNAARRRT